MHPYMSLPVQWHSNSAVKDLSAVTKISFYYQTFSRKENKRACAKFPMGCTDVVKQWQRQQAQAYKPHSLLSMRMSAVWETFQQNQCSKHWHALCSQRMQRHWEWCMPPTSCKTMNEYMHSCMILPYDARIREWKYGFVPPPSCTTLYGCMRWYTILSCTKQAIKYECMNICNRRYVPLCMDVCNIKGCNDMLYALIFECLNVCLWHHAPRATKSNRSMWFQRHSLLLISSDQVLTRVVRFAQGRDDKALTAVYSFDAVHHAFPCSDQSLGFKSIFRALMCLFADTWLAVDGCHGSDSGQFLWHQASRTAFKAENYGNDTSSNS